METKQCKLASLLLWTTAAALLSQNMVVPVRSAATFEDQKNYYSPDQNSGTPPTGSHSPPSHGSGGHGSPTPSHGTHSHGGSSSYGDRPPVNCSNPPSGGHHHATQSPPRGGGGGYHHSPPTFTPSPPTTPSTLVSHYWRTHPGLIWGLFGWCGTVGQAFGFTSLSGFGANMNLLQALSNTRTDGIGELYREGTAALLNSMVHRRFPYTTKQVRDIFTATLSSNKAAAAQAQLFKLANEGRMKPQA